jgi:hypothetical protein
MMHRLWHEWNWPGLLFCFFVVAFLPVCGFVGRKIEGIERRSGRGGKKMQLYFSDAFLGQLKANCPAELQAEKMMPKPVAPGQNVAMLQFSRAETAPTPEHVHIVDMDRGEIRISETGGIHARCAIAGCEEPVYISPNLARLHVVAEVGK